ncbi:TetR/AcrR family transcriptional regulator [Williamsia sp.]|uniref:TetR/AcrR family transcriptional regulator n=1 Tax=Williamsia sp. TaxID=1872085 RepID=UPI002F94B413
MSPTTSRETYFEAGLDILATSGYGALKLSEVCQRLCVTTGSFYHFFKNWGAYTEALLQHWLNTRTVQEMAFARSIPGAFDRVSALVQIGLSLPHGAEAAIRTWSNISDEVRPIQEEVDKNRYDIFYESTFELVGDPEQAHRFANWALYLLIGYEQASLPRDLESLKWIADQLLDAIVAQAEANLVN